MRRFDAHVCGSTLMSREPIRPFMFNANSAIVGTHFLKRPDGANHLQDSWPSFGRGPSALHPARRRVQDTWVTKELRLFWPDPLVHLIRPSFCSGRIIAKWVWLLSGHPGSPPRTGVAGIISRDRLFLKQTRQRSIWFIGDRASIAKCDEVLILKARGSARLRLIRPASLQGPSRVMRWPW